MISLPRPKDSSSKMVPFDVLSLIYSISPRGRISVRPLLRALPAMGGGLSRLREQREVRSSLARTEHQVNTTRATRRDAQLPSADSVLPDDKVLRAPFATNGVMQWLGRDPQHAECDPNDTSDTTLSAGSRRRRESACSCCARVSVGSEQRGSARLLEASGC